MNARDHFPIYGRITLSSTSKRLLGIFKFTEWPWSNECREHCTAWNRNNNVLIRNSQSFTYEFPDFSGKQLQCWGWNSCVHKKIEQWVAQTIQNLKATLKIAYLKKYGFTILHSVTKIRPYVWELAYYMWYSSKYLYGSMELEVKNDESLPDLIAENLVPHQTWKNHS